MAGYAQRTGADYEFALQQLRNDGSPDISFGSSSVAYAGFGADSDTAEGLVRDDLGNIVVAGTSSAGANQDEFALARFTPNGKLDPAFAGGGITRADIGPLGDTAQDVALDPVSKRIVVGGYDGPQAGADWALARYEGVPRCAGKVPTIAGTPGSETIRGTAGKDVITSGVGEDRVSGLCGQGHDLHRDRLRQAEGRQGKRPALRRGREGPAVRGPRQGPAQRRTGRRPAGRGAGRGQAPRRPGQGPRPAVASPGGSPCPCGERGLPSRAPARPGTGSSGG